ncbi:MAG: protein translocase subunit SecD [Thiothrix sp.]|nr:protein translocase subunit SecD [Thiothrix sp.]HPQ94423.1 protein translocase subunit SecD [Thiolinea sp.]
MNRYPLWKYLLLIVTLIVGLIYALPNLYPSDPSVQISQRQGNDLEPALMQSLEKTLNEHQLGFKSSELNGPNALIRFDDTETQLEASDLIRETLGREYVVALNLAPATPAWLQALNAQPMYLGLDLRGGVHFLMEVDMDAAKEKAFERYEDEFRDYLRNDKVEYLGVARDGEILTIKFKDAEQRSAGLKTLSSKYFNELQWQEQDPAETYDLTATIAPEQLQNIQKLALQQNITTLRKRVNELGVAEPVIQQQGLNRIVVQLPGVQDTARAKEILGATATLEFRMVDDTGNDPVSAEQSKRIPLGTQLFHESNGNPILLKRRVMLTGDYITDASSGFGNDTGAPEVNIVLNGKGGERFRQATGTNVGKLMAVIYIETTYDEQEVKGEKVRKPVKHQEVINVARIQDELGSRFRITGLDSPKEARDLALLLRAGALAAPLYIVEERTIGPNLGQANIDSGFKSILIGFVLVMVFMLIYYRLFGLFANLALTMNVVIIFAVMSMLQFTLTLPGMAGIVLTIGMAVDANVLIYERIKEELRNGAPVQTAINRGYDQAFSTIMDANVTTLIAALVLFMFGTGPIKGFAITLAIGIATSMFTAIVGSRALVNLAYGGRKVEKLSI